MKTLIVFFQISLLLSLASRAPLGTPTANSQSPSAAARSTPIGVGEMAPDFTLADQDKNQVALSAARGKSPVVLVFYRGYW